MRHPLLQIFLPNMSRLVLPGMVSGQIKFAGAAGNANAAADGGEPIVFGQGMADFSVQLLKLEKAVLHVIQRLQQGRFGNGRIALVTAKALFLAIQIAHDLGFEIGSADHIENLEQRDQGEVVVDRLAALLQARETVKQPLQPQPGADAFVEGVFVQDHLAVPLAQS